MRPPQRKGKLSTYHLGMLWKWYRLDYQIIHVRWLILVYRFHEGISTMHNVRIVKWWIISAGHEQIGLPHGILTVMQMLAPCQERRGPTEHLVNGQFALAGGIGVSLPGRDGIELGNESGVGGVEA